MVDLVVPGGYGRGGVPVESSSTTGRSFCLAGRVVEEAFIRLMQSRGLP